MYKIKENQTFKLLGYYIRREHLMKIEVRITYGIDKSMGF
jgi:hypothetical protein